MMAGGLSARAIRNYHARIHVMLGKATRLGLVGRNVADLVDLPRLEHRVVAMLTPEQARGFLESVRGHRLESLFVLAISAGPREGEILGLSWDRVHFYQAEIEISRSLQRLNGSFVLVEPKTKSAIRKVALSNLALASLQAHRIRQMEEALKAGPAWRNEFNLVFTTTVGTPIEKTHLIRRQFRPAMKRAGLSTKLRFHDLRHVAATLALGHGMPVPLSARCSAMPIHQSRFECMRTPSPDRNAR